MEKQQTLIGQRIGRIRVLAPLGKGGMGSVFIGHDDRLDRRVALKAIRSEHRFNPRMKARFLQEARILSRLKHPNICGIHDYIDGEESDFLVLELIDGRTLGNVADRLDHQQKLQVARQLLDVLVAAHGIGIIHRDLKPDNLMITGGAELKVLDFGLSRSVDPDAVVAEADHQPRINDCAGDLEATRADLGSSTEDVEQETVELNSASAESRDLTDRTLAGTILGTLGYMSPEQARGEQTTTACDVFSVGVILSELFSGKRAYPKTNDSQKALEMAARAEVQEPDSGDAELDALLLRMLSLAAAHRPTATDALERLDWIIDRPNRRLKRVLMVTAVSLLTVGLALTSWLAIRATRSELRALAAQSNAERTAEFLVELFESADPARSRGSDLPVRSVLDAGRDRLGTELDPEIRAGLQRTLGVVYGNLGELETSIELLEASLAGHLSSADELAAAESLTSLASVRNTAGDYEEARSLARRALDIRIRALGPDDPLNAVSLNALGNAQWRLGDLDAAETSHREALRIRERAFGAEHHAVAVSLTNLGSLHLERSAVDEAIPLYRRSIAIDEVALGADHYSLATTIHLLGMAQVGVFRFAEAQVTLRRAYEIRMRVLGPRHPHTFESQGVIADLALTLGDGDEAVALLEPVLPVAAEVLGADHGNVAWLTRLFGWARLATGDHAAAIEIFESLRDRAVESGSSWSEASAVASLARAQLDAGRLAEARVSILRAMEIRRTLESPIAAELWLRAWKAGVEDSRTPLIAAIASIEEPIDAYRWAELREIVLEIEDPAVAALADRLQAIPAYVELFD